MPVTKPEPYTAEMIAAVIAAMEEDCARLKGVKEYMTQNQVKELVLKNSKSLKTKGLPAFSAFANSAVDAVREHQLGG